MAKFMYQCSVSNAMVYHLDKPCNLEDSVEVSVHQNGLIVFDIDLQDGYAFLYFYSDAQELRWVMSDAKRRHTEQILKGVNNGVRDT